MARKPCQTSGPPPRRGLAAELYERQAAQLLEQLTRTGEDLAAAMSHGEWLNASSQALLLHVQSLKLQRQLSALYRADRGSGGR